MIHVFIISGQIWGPLNSMSDTTTSSSFVIDATATNFEKDVIERSHSIPVVIDFWASWCGPCLALGPVLEKLAREYDGKFLLAKVNTDKETELAHRFGVRSIPAVFGVRDGKPLDAFVGVQPESAIRAWLDRLMPTPAETLVAEAVQLEQSNPQAAEEKYSAALALDHDLFAAQVGLARIALEQGRLEDAQARILSLERRGFLEPDAEKIKAELTLRLQAGGVGSVELARAALAAKPDDAVLKLQLAEALAAAGQYEEALALCLELVERDRKGKGEQARQTMVAIFQLLPPDSELAIEYRRQLSLVLME
jgi:putative thioredoxin